MADTRTWEQLTSAERRERMKKYDQSVKKENAARRESQAAKPKKGKGDHLTNIFTVVSSRGKVTDKRVDDASK